MINLVVNIDKKYIDKMMVTLTSIFYNTNSKINLHIITFDEEIDTSDLIDELYLHFYGQLNSVKIHYLGAFSFAHSNHYFLKHISITAYGRLFIPKLLNNLSKVIYVDCDLVFDSDIKELWNMNISKYNVGGIKESWFTHLQRIGLYIKYPYLKDLNKKSYINSGVMLLNPKTLYKEEFSRRVIKFLQDNPRIHFGDQDIINFLLPNKHILDNTWNVTFNFIFRYRYGIFKKANVIHYVSAAKPWKKRLDLKFVVYLLFGPFRARKWHKYNKIYKKNK